ncbi:DUF2809 domain-containing protein [Spirosoma humi]
MQTVERNRIVYGLLTLVTMLLGLASRRFFSEFPFVRAYVGDGLWALMVFFGFAIVFNRWSVRSVALAALLFSVGIEVSQLYHATWIDSLRSTRLGGLVLGFRFVWSDLLCYSIGVFIGVLLERLVIPIRLKSK